jgi:3-deoxy-D-manno-octulosonate 8-phosphate phosphatase (KDO 8-P phosphatase)
VKRLSHRIRKKAGGIKLLLLDVDGVLTDGGIVIDSAGKETKRFNVQDGHGVRLLQEAGIQVGFITGRSSRVVAYRARELGVALLFQNAADKVATYERVKAKVELMDHQIAYAGDDLQDLPLLLRVGFSVTVKNGWEGLKRRVDYVTVNKGGEGAVREVAEVLLESQGKWSRLVRRFAV